MNLCFYTYYFGPNEHESNVIHEVPSENCDCYFFTNNIETYKRLDNTAWKRRFVPVSFKNDEISNCLDTKLLKTCPHLIDELNVYDYTVHMDSKQIIVISVDRLKEIIQQHHQCPILMLPHRWWPNIHNAVLEEFNRSMQYAERYRIQELKMKTYIEKKAQTFPLSVPIHYETGFIVRKQKDPTVIQLNEKWYDEIMECGIQCQISFFFIQQMFPNIVFPIRHPLDPLIVVHENYKNKTIEKELTKDGYVLWKMF